MSESAPIPLNGTSTNSDPSSSTLDHLMNILKAQQGEEQALLVLKTLTETNTMLSSAEGEIDPKEPTNEKISDRDSFPAAPMSKIANGSNKANSEDTDNKKHSETGSITVNTRYGDSRVPEDAVSSGGSKSTTIKEISRTRVFDICTSLTSIPLFSWKSAEDEATGAIVGTTAAAATTSNISNATLLAAPASKSSSSSGSDSSSIRSSNGVNIISSSSAGGSSSMSPNDANGNSDNSSTKTNLKITSKTDACADEEDEKLARMSTDVSSPSSPLSSSDTLSSYSDMQHRRSVDNQHQLSAIPETPITRLLIKSYCVRILPVVADSRMLESVLALDPKMVKDLWEQKTRLDHVFDSKNEKLYRLARESVFPEASDCSERFSNRAGDKLAEISEAVGNLVTVLLRSETDSHVKSVSYFFDICGGPGAWSEFIIEEYRRLQSTQSNNPFIDLPNGFMHKINGMGITLSGAAAESQLTWYPWLYETHRIQPVHKQIDHGHWSWTPVYGADCTGSIYNVKNIESCVEAIRRSALDEVKAKFNKPQEIRHPKGLLLAVADGGIKPDSTGHYENYQELFGGRLVLSEVLLMMKLLNPNGNFVCKLFDTFSNLTISLVYVCCRIFKSVKLIKPFRSRAVNSERYLVGLCLLSRDTAEFRNLLRNLEWIHSLWDRQIAKKDETPETVMPIDIIEADQEFINSLRVATSELCLNQTEALKLVNDKVAYLSVHKEEIPTLVAQQAEHKASLRRHLSENQNSLSYGQRRGNKWHRHSFGATVSGSRDCFNRENDKKDFIPNKAATDKPSNNNNKDSGNLLTIRSLDNKIFSTTSNSSTTTSAGSCNNSFATPSSSPTPSELHQPPPPPNMPESPSVEEQLRLAKLIIQKQHELLVQVNSNLQPPMIDSGSNSVSNFRSLENSDLAAAGNDRSIMGTPLGPRMPDRHLVSFPLIPKNAPLLPDPPQKDSSYEPPFLIPPPPPPSSTVIPDKNNNFIQDRRISIESFYSNNIANECVFTRAMPRGGGPYLGGCGAPVGGGPMLGNRASNFLQSRMSNKLDYFAGPNGLGSVPDAIEHSLRRLSLDANPPIVGTGIPTHEHVRHNRPEPLGRYGNLGFGYTDRHNMNAFRI